LHGEQDAIGAVMAREEVRHDFVTHFTGQLLALR
jgi:hypothetical protein